MVASWRLSILSSSSISRPLAVASGASTGFGKKKKRLEPGLTQLRSPSPGLRSCVSFRFGRVGRELVPPRLALRLHPVSVLRRREAPITDAGGVVGDRAVDGLADLAELFHELGRARGDAEHVVHHQNLPVARRGRANADRGD